MTPIWPDGSQPERDGTSVAVDPGGGADAIEVGQRVRLLGGGYSSKQYEDLTCGGRPRASAFEVDPAPFPSVGRSVPPSSPIVMLVRPPHLTPGTYTRSFDVAASPPVLRASLSPDCPAR